MISVVAMLAIQSSSLGERLNATIAPYNAEGGIIGVYVGKVDGTELYSHMADTRLMPASNQKIVSSAFAFAALGVQHRLQTRFWREPNGIYVDAPGDQMITPEQLREVANKLNVTGRARVYVKQAYDFGFGPGWEYDDLPFRYAPRVQAFSVNRSQFDVVSSGNHVVVPDWARVKVSYGNRNGKLTVDYDREHQRLHVTGTPEKDELVTRFALPEPAASAASFLGRQMVTTDSVPSRTPDAVIDGPTLAEWGKACLEPSDNLLAENLLIQATIAKNPGKPFSYSLAQQSAREFYEKVVKIPEFGFKLDDGSGLSRHNLVTPRTLAHILRYVYSQPFRDDYIRALPAAGEGTLGSRLAGVRITAKTGTLDSVSCLSGFLWIGQSDPVVVSIMMNHYSMTASQARQLQDQIVQVIREELNSFESQDGRNANWCVNLENPFSDPSFVIAYGHRGY
ncbi:MAG: D-alanyl-D-alanine carboxypeptidase [Fimbriimonadaceae bacterium]|nr:D-alanyl-D-alanine carboxypeptidase [Fimbriimonadaceae bacterium]